MHCDECGENEAILHLTQIVDNQMSTKHLCERCAAEKGVDSGQVAVPFALTDFLGQVGQVGRGETGSPAPCAFCGLQFDEFKKTGRLGCPQCYEAFESNLKSLLRRLHGSVQHLGKVYLPPDPSLAQRTDRLAGLRRKLDRAVESEDFERAAEIRDEIQELEAASSD